GGLLLSSKKSKGLKGKALLLFYSRTGKTRSVMGALKEALDERYDVELVEVKPKVRIGFFKGGSMAKRGEAVEVEELKVNFSDYDLIVFGTPVWNGCPTPPINAVMGMISDLSGRRVALVVTCAFSAGATVNIIAEKVRSKKGEFAGSLVVKTMFGIRRKALEKVEEFSRSL
ncbi:MAG: NAD(P)H-dependent oxidoreductase, partial [Candidatus Freyarchaeota archaeon]|nr:NAD(P)H-dependent oxidoreductase [Candidatus Jordarchaeia archaeon]